MRLLLNRLASLAITSTIKRVLKAALSNPSSGRAISKSLEQDVKDHVQFKYPGSTHWSPDKVSAGMNFNVGGQRVSGEVNVDVPGAGRAYHDVTILPRKAKALAIPIHPAAFGKSPKDFSSLFIPKDKAILAMSAGKGRLIPMFALARRAFQRQDPSLMPSDGLLAFNVGSRWISNLVETANEVTR